jgi:AhpD family alkylhydroperoxidase
MDLGFENQAFGVHEQMTLPAAHLLASVVTALFSAYTGCLGGLGVHDACAAGLGVSPRELSQALAQRRINRSKVPSIRHFLNQ